MKLSFFFLVTSVLELASAWKVFEKYGEPGWKGLIPFYSDYIEYDKIWMPNLGLFYAATVVISQISQQMQGGLLRSILGVLVMAGFVVNIIFSRFKAAAFGKGRGMTLLLILLPFVGNLILGFGSDRYLGNPSGDHS
jgi:hypothetical protein